MSKLFIPLIFVLFLITGCDNNDFMQSESTVNGKLTGSWKMFSSNSIDPNQYWKMDKGTLTIFTKAEGNDSVIDRGNYDVLTKFSKCYITISGLKVETSQNNPRELNTRWNIAELSNTVLYISSTSPSGAIISREFVKN